MHEFLTSFDKKYCALIKEAPTADESLYQAARKKIKAEREAASAQNR